MYYITNGKVCWHIKNQIGEWFENGGSALALSDLSEADQKALTNGLSSYSGHIAKVSICANRNKLAAEQREANAQAKAERKTVRERLAAERAAIELEKAEKRAKQAQEKLAKLQAKAAPAKPSKRSHHPKKN